MGLALVRAKLSQVWADGAWNNPAKVKTIHAAVTAACDALDGLTDGVIGLYEACMSVFDVSSLRCPNGVDSGDTCLSDRQIELDRLVHEPYRFPFPLKYGVNSFPGWNYGGEDQRGGLGASSMGVSASRGSGPVRSMFARDLEFNVRLFEPEDFETRIREISDMFDATDPDLSAFLARGGKLILKGNGADYQRSLLQEVAYYKSVVAKMGQAEADSFIRFYVTPGVNHGGEGVMSDGKPVPSDVDLLGALDAWVDQGHAPGTLSQVTQENDAPFNVVASRPMCLYPLYPRYDGKGDPTDAASFSCARQ